MKTDLDSFLEQAGELLEDIPDSSITGDGFGNQFVEETVNTFMPQDPQSRVFSCLFLYWPGGDPSSLDTDWPVYLLGDGNRFTLEHGLGDGTPEHVVYSPDGYLLGEESFHLESTGGDSALFTLYERPTPKKFFKLVIFTM
jgi:hypothetical protein